MRKLKMKIIISLALLLLCYCTSATGIEVLRGEHLEITTEPPGPVYMASSWIRFACNTWNHSQPQTLRYEWHGFTSFQGEETLTVTDPLLDGLRSAFIWLLSTSDIRYLECQVFDGSRILEAIGVNIAVTGAGVHLENVFLASLDNNTAILNTDNPGAPSLLCQSALKTTCETGQWMTPNNICIGNCNVSTSCDSSATESMDTVFSSARLVLSPDLASGVYTCVIPDEVGVTRNVYIGIYSDLDDRVIPFKSSLMVAHRIAGNQLSLSCITRALQATATHWQRDNFILSSSDYLDSHIRLMDIEEVQYSSELSLQWSGEEVSNFNCLVYAEWRTPGGSTNYDATTANGQFVVMMLGSSTTIECTNSLHIVSIEWLDENSNSLDLSLFPNLEISGNTLSIRNALDRINGLQFQCRVQDAIESIQVWIHYSIIISASPDIMTVTLIGNYSQPVYEGDEYNITCCYSTNSTGGLLSADPMITWYKDEIIEIGSDSGIYVIVENECSTLHFVSVSTEDNGVYSCRAGFDPPLLYTEQTTLHTASLAMNIFSTTDVDSSAERLSVSSIHSLIFVMLFFTCFNLIQ